MTDIKSIWDNGGETIDRFSVVLDEKCSFDESLTCIGMTQKGEWYHSGAFEGEHLGKKINFDDLPIDCKESINSILKG